ncbi:MAG: hypothetical protein ABR961_03445 [Thermoanaerobaculaceae bacterium]
MTKAAAPPIPVTYSQQWWDEMTPDGTSWHEDLNWGHYAADDTVPPALGTTLQVHSECLVHTDGATLRTRELRCTCRDTLDGYENGAPELTLWPDGTLFGVAEYTRRFANRAFSNDQHDVVIERIGLAAKPHGVTSYVDDPWPYIAEDWISVPGSSYFTEGMVDLHGQHYAYYQVWLTRAVPQAVVLERWQITDTGVPTKDLGFGMPVVEPDGGFSQIVADPSCDGCMFGFESAYPPLSDVSVWRSHDEGRTFKEIAFVIPAPAGSVGISDCHAMVWPGGIAVWPGFGKCQTYWAQDGDDGTDWSKMGDLLPYTWSMLGAPVPANFNLPTTLWAPPTPIPTVTKP